MNIATKLTIFPGSFTPIATPFVFAIFSMKYHLGETSWDKRTFAIMHYK
jgi:hypothetical protein